MEHLKDRIEELILEINGNILDFEIRIIYNPHLFVFYHLNCMLHTHSLNINFSNIDGVKTKNIKSAIEIDVSINPFNV